MKSRRHRAIRAGMLSAGVVVLLAAAVAQVAPAGPLAAGTPLPSAATPGATWLVTGPPPTTVPTTVPTAPATIPPTVTTTTAAARPVRIMPLGDSITFGSGSSTKSSYRVDLHRRLTAAGLDVDFVGSVRSGAGADTDNEGHPGWRIGQIAERVDGWLAEYRPDVVLLHIGTNDMRTDARALGAAGRLSALIDQIATARPATRIFVARIIGAWDPATQGRIDAYNAAIPGIVASKGSRVRLVDLSTVGGADLADKLHPNDTGYARMSYLWNRALRRVLAGE